MRFVERSEGAADVVRRVVLEQDHVAWEVCEHAFEEGTVALRVELAVDALEIEAAAKAVEQTEDAIGFADADGLDGGLDAFEGPGIAEAAPLGETRFVAEERPKGHPGVLVLGEAQNLGPGLFE